MIDQSRREFLRSTAGAGLGLAGLPAFADAAAASGAGATDHVAVKAVDVHAAVDRAIGVLVANGFDDFFPRSAAIDLLAGDPAVKEELSFDTAAFLGGGASVRSPYPATKVAWPKGDRYEHRYCTLLEPRDATAYLTVAVCIAHAMEPWRVPLSDNRIFSYRFSPDARSFLFDPHYTASAFRAETVARLTAERRTYLVRTDIESFYPQIVHDRLKSILAACNVEKYHVNALIRLLQGWQDADGRGIPIGPDASNILAEAALIEVDRDLLAANVSFIRYVDDYRLFAPDQATAQSWLDLLRRRLADERLTLNANKTEIHAVTRSEYEAWWVQRNLGLLSAGRELVQDSPPQPRYGSRRPPKARDDDSGARKWITKGSHKWTALEDFLLQLRLSNRPDLKDIRIGLEAGYRHGAFPLLEKFIGLIDRSPNVLPYVADLLIQESGGIPEDSRRRIAELLGKRLNSREAMMDYEVVGIAGILAAAPYRNTHAIAEFLRSDRFRDLSPTLTQFVLAALDTDIDEDGRAFLEARFAAADPSERWAIARLLLPVMSHDRRSAFMAREQARADSDAFLETIFASYGNNSGAITS